MKEVVELLIKEKKTISTMESCTGGGVVNEITSVEGASEILKFSAVTYSNEFKIKMGVSKEVIDEYSVYSMNTACEMSKSISEFTISKASPKQISHTPSQLHDLIGMSFASTSNIYSAFCQSCLLLGSL